MSSQRGQSGGWRLARSADEVSVADVIRDATGLLAPGEVAWAPAVDGRELVARLDTPPPGADQAPAPAPGWDPRIAWATDRWIGWTADEWDILDARVFFLVGATSSPAVLAHPAAASGGARHCAPTHLRADAGI